MQESKFKSAKKKEKKKENKTLLGININPKRLVCFIKTVLVGFDQV